MQMIKIDILINSRHCILAQFLSGYDEEKHKCTESVRISWPYRMAQFSWSGRPNAVRAVLLQLGSEFKGLAASVPTNRSPSCPNHTANTLRVLVWSFKPKML